MTHIFICPPTASEVFINDLVWGAKRKGFYINLWILEQFYATFE